MSEDIKNVNEELQIVVNDGYLRVPIKNELGDVVGEFKFNPTDVGILDRFKNMDEKLKEIVKPLSEVNIHVDGTSEDPEEMDVINEVKQQLFDFCDYLFGGKMSEAFFGHVHPFSPVNGKFYCENVLSAVSNFVASRFAAEQKKISKRVQQYTHGYRTGKHKDGKK